MKLIKYIALCLLLNTTINLKAQYARFVTAGSITFEKRINAYAIVKKQVKDWGEDNSFANQFIENYEKNNAQFKTLTSQLNFNANTTAYLPNESTVASNNFFGDFIQFQQNNKILTDVTNGTVKIQKKVYDETYLVSDSTRKINWKITDEFRNIAGYNCRRANALVMDSIYVVAFYTDEIAVSGGPETFNGLPGMILGLAMPHDNVTWFATSVTDTPVTEDKLKIPTKGKPVNNKQLYDILKGALKSWGKSANTTFKWALL